jgi:hypothetical protein
MTLPERVDVAPVIFGLRMQAQCTFHADLKGVRQWNDGPQETVALFSIANDRMVGPLPTENFRIMLKKEAAVLRT